MNPPLAPPVTHRTGRISRTRRILLFVLVFVVAGAAALFSQEALPRPTGRGGDAAGLVRAAWDVALARVGETPRLEARPWNGEISFCGPLSPSEQRAFRDGVAMMRATEQGADLFRLLQNEGVCLGVEDLAYNSAYATARWSPVNGWADSEIRVDPSYVTFLYPDVLGAILVHEATHMQRAIDHTACYYANACTELPNGVYLEEEVVAHSAEAEFWIAIFGRDGKDRALANDHAENQLKAFYLQGSDAFVTFVREMRSDSREGEGIE